MPQPIQILIEQGDIVSSKADVVALKYAQSFYGADAHIADALQSVGVSSDSLKPAIGDYRYVPSKGVITAPFVLFMGVPRLRQFSYPEIRAFAAQVLHILADVAPN